MSIPPDPSKPSARVALEVSLLDESVGAPAGDAPAPAASVPPSPSGVRLILVAAIDADLRRYVCESLRGRPDLRVVEAPMLPHLVITDRPVAGPPAAAPPHLVLAQEPGDGPDRPGAGEALVGPFNARQLLEAVERVLGPRRERP